MPVKMPAMPNTQHAQRKLLYKLLGDLPPRNRKIAARTVAVERRENYVLEKLMLDLNGIEPVPAYFVKPHGKGDILLFHDSKQQGLRHKAIPTLPPTQERGMEKLSVPFSGRAGGGKGDIQLFPTAHDGSRTSQSSSATQRLVRQQAGKSRMSPFPVVLYNHAHGANYVLGKDEMLDGRSSLQAPPYAEELARMGCSALCIDHWAFGERRGRTEGEIFREMLWRGQVMWGMMIYDTLRAVDYLCSRDDVDGSRIATLGLSMGSTLAWWAAALDERIKVTVDICCMSEYEELIKTRALETHGVYYFVPGLLKHFTTSSINELIAPRPHLCLAGNFDRLTPPAGLDIVDRDLRKAYKSARAPEAWKMLRYETGHFETADMRREIVAFLGRWL
jgi:hypothetical protein